MCVLNTSRNLDESEDKFELKEMKMWLKGMWKVVAVD